MKDTKTMYLFMGPPGSGKGSLAQKCVEGLGWKQLSTGNLCRKHISEQTQIGKEIDFAIKSGKLISDEFVTAMVAQWLEQDAKDAPAVILDGYPRTVAQAQALDKLLKDKFSDWDLQVIRLGIADDAVVDRLSKRYICQNNRCQAVYSFDGTVSMTEEPLCKLCEGKLGRRSDDELSAIRDRLVIYHKHEDDLLQFYRDKGMTIKPLDVDKPLSDVFRDFKYLIGVNAA